MSTKDLFHLCKEQLKELQREVSSMTIVADMQGVTGREFSQDVSYRWTYEGTC
ncbi:unnamed protein product [Symbiodinium pilosum]|uniref:Uncharacterized protein n=1 Tax=Symbiodinium pilosum TaxID=2952 RepID=A0A812MZZ5_SYMPI|nr:unnamed protein product [Symbiodinium pilosum]